MSRHSILYSRSLRLLETVSVPRVSNASRETTTMSLISVRKFRSPDRTYRTRNMHMHTRRFAHLRARACTRDLSGSHVSLRRCEDRESRSVVAAGRRVPVLDSFVKHAFARASACDRSSGPTLPNAANATSGVTLPGEIIYIFVYMSHSVVAQRVVSHLCARASESVRLLKRVCVLVCELQH